MTFTSSFFSSAFAAGCDRCRVPLTFPAHQAAVLPLKLWRPRWFDGTALVVGAGVPDLLNVMGFVNTFESHKWSGVAVAVPFTVIYSMVLRRYGVDGLFGSIPDFGPLKARSYRVLQHGRPRFLVTLWSALIGVLSHVIVDSFTHTWRTGSQTVGFDNTLFTGPDGPVSIAKTLQYLGHTVGSLVGMLLFVLVVSDKHLGEWYGKDVIDDARDAPVRTGASERAKWILATSVAIGAVWGLQVGWFPIFHIGFTTVLGFLVIGIVNRPSAATLATCPDTCIHLTTTSSTRSVERSSKISPPSAISARRSSPKALRRRPRSSFAPEESSRDARVWKRRFDKSTQS